MLKLRFSQLKYPILASLTIPIYYGYNFLINNKGTSRKFLTDELYDQINKLGEFDISVARIYEKLAELDMKENKIEEAISYFKKAVGIHQLFGDISSNELSTLYRNLAICYKSIEKDHEYLLSLKACYEWKFKNFKNDDFLELKEYFDLISKLENIKRTEEAEESYSNLFGIVSSLISEESNQALPIIFKLKDLQIDCLIKLGKLNILKCNTEYIKNNFLNAQKYFDDALYISRNRPDQQLSVTNEILFNLAKINYSLNKMDRAVDYCKESFTISESIKDYLNIPYFYCNSITGSDFLHRGNQQMAEKYLKKSIESFEQLQTDGKLTELDLNENDIQYSQSLTNLGLVYYKQKKPSSSIEYTKKGLAILEKLKGDTDRDYLAVRYNLAVSLFEAGEQKEAWDVISDVYLKSKNKFGDAYPLTASALQFINLFTLQR